MAINKPLELFLERREQAKKEQEQYDIKCKELGLETDPEALEEVLNIINSVPISKDKRGILCDYINAWYRCYENEWL